MLSRQICIASKDDLPPEASPPVSAMPRPIVIGSADLAAPAKSTPAASTADASRWFLCRFIQTSQFGFLCRSVRSGGLSAGANKAIDPTLAADAVQHAFIHQEIEVSERLAKGEAHLVPVEGAP